MLFFQLFYTFLLIGLFTFGGGYSMVALISGEVVGHWGWLTTQEFADLLAISQTTPGPIGINAATYAGYTVIANAGYPLWAAVGGSLIATLAVIALPLTLALTLGSLLLRHKDHPRIVGIMKVLRPAVLGLIGAVALQLMPEALSDAPTGTVSIFNYQFSIISLIIFVVVLALSLRPRVNPLWLIGASALAGIILF